MKTKLSRRGLLVLTSGMTLSWLAGCGGSSGSTDGTPTRAVQERVSSISRKLFSGTMLFGAVDGIGGARGGGMGGGALPPGGGAYDQSYTSGSTPQLGAFLKNVVMENAPNSRKRKQSRQEDIVIGEPFPGDPMPPFWEPQPTFYFDYYLGLWVQTSYGKTESRYDLFEDEAKTKPAGSIVSSWPINWEVFPQVWKSSYEFTAGFMKGSYGSSENVTNAGWSGSSKYENVYIDGWKDKGQSNWSGQGDSSWFNRTESADGKDWTESAGSWRSNGSGGTRMSTSDGYEAVFTFNNDGSGRGTIRGPEAGLPASISWDTQGNVTIRYADGTVDRFNRWGIYPGPIPLDGGGIGGTGGGGGTGGDDSGEIYLNGDGSVSSGSGPRK